MKKKNISGKIASPLLWPRHELSSRFRVFLTTRVPRLLLSTVTTRVASSCASSCTGRCGALSSSTPAIVPPRLLFHFYVYDQRATVAVTVIEIRLEACPIDLWPWACVVSSITGSWRGIRVCSTKCVARSCSCRCMQEEIPEPLPTGAKRAPRHAGREKCVYHGLLRHYSRSGVSRGARQDPLLQRAVAQFRGVF